MTVILKLGGSLLTVADMPVVIERVLEQRPQSAPLLVIGGGAAADAVREWDRVHQLGDVAAHELALEAMGLNESFILRIIPGTRLVRNEKQFHAAIDDGVLPVLCAACFLPWAESRGHAPLPRSWNVTSDSIAAWVARVLDADELILLKSTSLPARITISEAVRQSLVDAHFPTIAAGLRNIRWCNARDPQATIVPFGFRE